MKSRTRSLDAVSLGLLCALFLISGAGMAKAGWVEDLRVVPVVGVLGVLAGAALARSHFRGPRAAFFASIYGLFVVAWQATRTLDEEIPWGDRLGLLASRVDNYLGVMLWSRRNEDPLMFVVLMASLYWIMGVAASWIAFRRGGLWGAVVPAGLVLLVNIYYYVGPDPLEWIVGAYVLATLIFVLTRHLAARRAAWEAMRTDLPAPGGLAISQAGLVAALLLVVVAWGVPAFAKSEGAADLWSGLTRPWPRLRERIGDVFGNLGRPALVARDVFQDTLDLEAGTEPPDNLVMYVRPDPEAGGRLRFYWRARVYDTYLEGRWSTSAASPLAFDPETGDIPVADFASRTDVEAVFAPHLKAFQVLYFAGEPLWADRPALASVTYADLGKVDVTALASQSPVLADETYRVRASLPVPRAEELRSAGTDYPSWVLDRYLQLPETITDRTRDLAVEIAAGASTPYDRVVAVTRWLREHIAYSRITEGPPESSEPVDWILFDYRVGFCNYYASAEVVLLRLLGIPARMAAGYASGTYDAATGTYEVRSGDAHAWPEIFFPDYGWVEFEPTASLPNPAWAGISGGGEAQGELLFGDFDLPDRLDQSLDRGLGAGLEPEGEPAGRSAFAGLVPVLLAVGALLLGIAGVVVWIMLDPYAKAVVLGAFSQRLRRIGFEPPPSLRGIARPAATPTERMYLRLTLWLQRLGEPISASQTPFERAAALAERVPGSGRDAWSVVNEYAGERFGGTASDEAAVREAWRSLRPRLWSAWTRRTQAVPR
jgi:transglutaminase-like putative cysteine protease